MKAEIVIANGILEELTLEPDTNHVAVITVFPAQEFMIIYDRLTDQLEINVGLSITEGYTWNPTQVRGIEVPDAAVQQALDLTPEWRESFKQMWLGFLETNGYLK